MEEVVVWYKIRNPIKLCFSLTLNHAVLNNVYVRLTKFNFLKTICCGNFNLRAKNSERGSTLLEGSEEQYLTDLISSLTFN